MSLGKQPGRGSFLKSSELLFGRMLIFWLIMRPDWSVMQSWRTHDSSTNGRQSFRDESALSWVIKLTKVSRFNLLEKKSPDKQCGCKSTCTEYQNWHHNVLLPLSGITDIVTKLIEVSSVRFSCLSCLVSVSFT